MKRFLPIVFLLLITLIGYSSVPERMSYQAVIRNSSGGLVTNRTVAMRISIMVRGFGVDQVALYTELHTPKTNENGLVTIGIGGGEVVLGNLKSINWDNGPFYLQTEVDVNPSKGSNYSILGSSQLLSVPFALHSKKAIKADTAMIALKVNQYAVGDSLYGGIIYWLDETGQHGLIYTYFSGVGTWCGEEGNVVTFAGGKGIYSGATNTAIMLAKQGGSYWGSGMDDSHFYENAADLCQSRTGKKSDGYYGGWYLPSIGELECLYDSKLLKYKEIYWSSTEYKNQVNASKDYAYAFNFETGQQVVTNKSTIHRVVAVCRF